MSIRVVVQGRRPLPDPTGILGFTGWLHGVIAIAWPDPNVNRGVSSFDANRFDLTTPVRIDPDELVDLRGEVRERLARGDVGDAVEPLPKDAAILEYFVLQKLTTYIEPKGQGLDRLYALEFQGPRQYVMFGHSRSLLRRVAQHQLSATPHGYGLVDGWASPGLPDAYGLERMALDVGRQTHSKPYRERYYGMPFDTGLTIVRAIFEYNTNWRRQRQRWLDKCAPTPDPVAHPFWGPAVNSALGFPQEPAPLGS